MFPTLRFRRLPLPGAPDPGHGHRTWSGQTSRIESPAPLRAGTKVVYRAQGCRSVLFCPCSHKGGEGRNPSRDFGGGCLGTTRTKWSSSKSALSGITPRILRDRHFRFHSLLPRGAGFDRPPHSFGPEMQGTVAHSSTMEACPRHSQNSNQYGGPKMRVFRRSPWPGDAGKLL